MKTGIVFFCFVLFLAIGCAEIPRSATFSYSSQQQLQSATHWQIIAQLTTARLSSDPDLLDILKPYSGGSRRRIHVQTSDKSPFDEAFRKYLITELINAHFLLSDTPNDAPVRIHWDLQLISCNPERLKPQGWPEAVAEALWEFLSGTRWTKRGLMVTHTELILTTRITVGKDSPAYIIKSYSDTFYINDEDWNNYNYQLAASSDFPRSMTSKEETWRRWVLFWNSQNR